MSGCVVSFLNHCFCDVSVPELLGGKQLSATVIDLSPWVEYEFRVLATNSIGTGEPSRPSKKTRTKEMRTCQKLFCQGQELQSRTEQNSNVFFFFLKLNKTLMQLQPNIIHLCSHQTEQTLHILILNWKRYMNILAGSTLILQFRGWLLPGWMVGAEDAQSWSSLGR